MNNMSDYNPSIKIHVSTEDTNNYTMVSFKGDIDKAGLAAIKDELDLLIEKSATQFLLFDFRDMNFINSEGIGYLMTVHYRLLKRDKKFCLVNCSERVKDVLNVIGLTKLVPCYDSLDSFLKS
jgi:stage II sporulation protein AA (anti-sigma F factor antagonist)